MRHKRRMLHPEDELEKAKAFAEHYKDDLLALHQMYAFFGCLFTLAAFYQQGVYKDLMLVVTEEQNIQAIQQYLENEKMGQEYVYFYEWAIRLIEQKEYKLLSYISWEMKRVAYRQAKQLR